MREMSALKQIHTQDCRCGKCYAKVMGHWIDSLGAVTGPGHWQLFATITYSTVSPPWSRGFPIATPKPKPDFAHHLFDRFVLHLEAELLSRVDYVVADQFGAINGRFHEHAILASPGLDNYSRRKIWQWLREKAGWNRILPFMHGASYYISRYIGRDANRCEWEVRVGQPWKSLPKAPVGRVVVVESAAMARRFFKNSRTDRKR
jgi:hypothetical protein